MNRKPEEQGNRSTRDSNRSPSGPEARLNVLLDLAEALDIQIRWAAFEGRGAVMCVLKGQRVLFLDSEADRATQYDRVLHEFAQIPKIDTVHLRADVREDIERAKN